VREVNISHSHLRCYQSVIAIEGPSTVRSRIHQHSSISLLNTYVVNLMSGFVGGLGMSVTKNSPLYGKYFKPTGSRLLAVVIFCGGAAASYLPFIHAYFIIRHS
jgi:hypothetical protein